MEVIKCNIWRSVKMQVVGRSCGGCDMELESIMICEVRLKEVVEPCS